MNSSSDLMVKRLIKFLKAATLISARLLLEIISLRDWNTLTMVFLISFTSYARLIPFESAFQFLKSAFSNWKMRSEWRRFPSWVLNLVIVFRMFVAVSKRLVIVWHWPPVMVRATLLNVSTIDWHVTVVHELVLQMSHATRAPSLRSRLVSFSSLMVLSTVTSVRESLGSNMHAVNRFVLNNHWICSMLLGIPFRARSSFSSFARHSHNVWVMWICSSTLNMARNAASHDFICGSVSFTSSGNV